MVDDWTVKYCYDGDHTIAEYDGENRLLRKYIYGPRVDEPICMVDVADSNAVYYYHFDGLGSVIALSDEDGNTVQSYEYTVYGQVAAEDVNHPNPITFTGRWFDRETGLYYYRARYYNPYIGRFLQTDPVGYGYSYCHNNPSGWVDPSGCLPTLVMLPPFKVYVPTPYIVQQARYIGGEALEGPWLVSTAPVWWTDLAYWYFYGKGMGLWYIGSAAGKIITSDPTITSLVRNYMMSWTPFWALTPGWWWCEIASTLTEEIHTVITNYEGRASVSFTTEGYSDFKSGASLTRHLLNVGTLYMDGRMTKVWDGDHIITLTITAKYSFVDRADFHPDKYGLDLFSTIAEIVFNYGDLGSYSWFMRRFSGLVAQPYNLLITTNPITTVIQYNFQSKQITFLYGWPK